MEKKRMVASLYASRMTYQIEAMRLLKNNKKVIRDYVNGNKQLGLFPAELEYVSSFYDSNTGSSGSLFKNIEEDNYILAYTGTNPVTDLRKDIETDIYSVCMGLGYHYKSCFNFYKKVREKYGDNIILTGHSLGGNIAQRVAIEFNVAKTIIYNSAFLYIENGVDLFMTVTETNRELYTKRLRRYNRQVKLIKERLSNFTGEITHFSSEGDFIGRLSALAKEEVFILGKNYIVKNGGGHSLSSLEQSAGQEIDQIIKGKISYSYKFTLNYRPISKIEALFLENLSNSSRSTYETIVRMFVGNELPINVDDHNLQEVDVNKFIRYIVAKVH